MNHPTAHHAAAPGAARTLAQALNEGYACQTLDPQRLRAQLAFHPSLRGMVESMTQSHASLFSKTQVFLSETDRDTIAGTVAAIERVALLPGYQHRALDHADPIARLAFGPTSMFMGYDFHVGAHGPKLIEINTNAGGALLNAALARSQQPCCELLEGTPHGPTAPIDLNLRFLAMFQAEWRSQRGEQPLRSVVIVDDAPQAQYLAPEFELCRQLLAQHGIWAQVADPSELAWRDGRLWHGNTAIDMVYNRLTDFYLSEPRHGALRAAYLSGATVLSPHPRAHALLAEKGNLVALSQTDLLQQWGATATDRALLAKVVPRALRVTPERAEALWAERRAYFFKPVCGYGSKAAYRGDKLTRRVWNDILAGDFIAQELVPPGQRRVCVQGETQHLKFDIRAYSYAGQVQLLAARTYTGQTTNFRTPGGGFAPVVVVPDSPPSAEFGGASMARVDCCPA